MNDKLQGIVLSQRDYREHDAQLEILTENCGRLTLNARGLRKMESKNAYSCMPYTLSEFCFDYKENATLFSLHSASVISPWRSIKEDIMKMSAAAVLAEMVTSVLEQGVIDELANELYFYLKAALELLNNHQETDLIISLFGAKLLDLLGLNPVVDECAGCGSTKVSAISIQEGGFVCAECSKHLQALQGEVSLLRTFRLINKADFSHFEILKEHGCNQRALSECITAFIAEHSGINLKSWRFYTSL